MKFRILGAVVAATAGLTLTSSGGAVAVDNEALTRDLDTILADPALTGADVGLVVRDANTGDVVYTRTSARRQQIASNMKVLTTTAALELLGPDYKWKTELLSSGTRNGSTLQGDLVLRGTGVVAHGHGFRLAQTLLLLLLLLRELALPLLKRVIRLGQRHSSNG